MQHAADIIATAWAARGLPIRADREEEYDAADLATWLADDVEFDEVALFFDEDEETGIEEPYSWGGSRGSFTTVSATLRGARIDGQEIDREAFQARFSKACINALEEQFSEKFQMEFV